MKRFLLFFGAFAVGLAAACLAAAALLLPGWLAGRELRSQRPTAAVSAAATPTPEPAPTPLPQMDFTALLAQNPDVVGWIRIEDTPVDFPVLQGDDNEFYLRHGLDGEYDILGVPYVDYECDVEQGRHLILYGHNMGVGESERFSSLQNYKDPDYYTRHPVIQLDTLYCSALYKVVAVYALTARTTDASIPCLRFKHAFVKIAWMRRTYTLRSCRALLRRCVHASPHANGSAVSQRSRAHNS